MTVEGPLAGAMRRAAYLYRQPTAQQQVSVGASWLQQAAEQGAALAQRTFAAAAPVAPRRREIAQGSLLLWCFPRMLTPG